MKITGARAQVEHFELVRPYTIAFRTISAVANVIVTLQTETGHTGLGAASPEPHVTGETGGACQAALQEPGLQWLLGQDVRTLPALCRELYRRLPKLPAARAAVDIALHDLYAQRLGLPLVEVLGRVHQRLPTSITIGIKPPEETLEEAHEYLGRGFRVLKVKLGHSLEEDLQRLHRLREAIGAGVPIRVDPNQGYTLQEVQRFVTATAPLGIELLEQPMPVGEPLRALAPAVRAGVAVDEALLNESDALALAAPPPACGIFNIKLMKCGGVWSAQRIAAIAENAGIALMWGCMDESVISIAAALHAALASPATRYLDLDGSLDLARDVATGGFLLEDGYLRTLEAPGLGLQGYSTSAPMAPP